MAPRSPLLGDPRWALFVLVFGVYAYFYQGGGWNQNSRFDLTRAIVEQGTACIDAYEFNTGDKARVKGRYYCDKAPGVSFLAVPVYAAFHPFAEGQRPKARLVSRAAYLSTLLVVSLPSALAAVLLSTLGTCFGWSRRGATGLALAWALGTMAFPYSTLLYGHQLAAAMLLTAFALLIRLRQAAPLSPSHSRWLALVGLLLGATVAIEYPPALAVAVLLGYAALTVRPWPRLLWLLAGMIPPVVALAAYHWTVFGGPFTLPYHHDTEAPRHQGIFLGVSTPQLDILYKILIGEQRGLFVFSPWLLLAIPGLLRLLRQRRFRLEGIVCLLTFALFAAFNTTLSTSPTDWRAGWGMGPRHLIAGLPFLAIGVGGLLLPADRTQRSPARRRLRQLGVVLAGLLVAFSVSTMLIATSVRPEAPTAYRRPFQDFLIPAFCNGELAQNTIPIHTGIIKERREAWNWGEAFGLSGLPTLIPLGVFAALTGAWLLACLRRPPGEPDRT